MRFVLLSIEFDAGTFSGNGVYACSQVGFHAAAPRPARSLAGVPFLRRAAGRPGCRCLRGAWVPR